jgi:hypothetical protein
MSVPTGGGAYPAAAAAGSGHPNAAASVQRPTAVIDDAALRAEVEQFVAGACPGAPADVAGAVQNLFVQDYGSIGSADFGSWLGQMSRLLAAMEANPAGSRLMEAVLQRVQTGMEQLPADLLNDMVVEKNEVKVWQNGREQVVGQVDDHLAQVIDTAKDHAPSAASCAQAPARTPSISPGTPRRSAASSICRRKTWTPS